MSSFAKLANVLHTYVAGKLSTLTIFVTDWCNARCSFCFNWQAIKKKPSQDLLSLSEYDRVAKSLGSLPTLIISGGEPFLRPDLPEIIQCFIKHCGTRHVSIPTNGMIPALVSASEKIVSGNPSVLLRILVGVDGVGEDHDRLRGVKGGFARMDANLEELLQLVKRHPNLTVCAVTVFHSETSKNIRQIAEWVHQRGFYEHKLQIIRGDYEDKSLAAFDFDVYKEALAYVDRLFRIRKRKNGTSSVYEQIFSAINQHSRKLAARRWKEKKPIISCLAGRRILIIRENGDVFPCELLANRRLGNLRELDFDWKKLLQSAELKATLAWIKDTKCSCSTECNAIIDSVYNPVTWPSIAREWLFPPRKVSRSHGNIQKL